LTKIHTEQLNQKFGNIKATILESTKTIRISKLIDQKQITRTFAITKFNSKQTIVDKNTIQKIINGNLIGKTLKNNNYIIKREIINTFTLKSEYLQKEFHDKKDQFRADLINFLVLNNNQITKTTNKQPYNLFAQILEIYPTYLYKIEKTTTNKNINNKSIKQKIPKTFEKILKKYKIELIN
jgi:hypothetical protein